jgi:hypothetical protein
MAATDLKNPDISHGILSRIERTQINQLLDRRRRGSRSILAENRWRLPATTTKKE